MQTLDRKNPPAFKTVEKIDMIKASEQRLRNNIPVYSVNAGTQALIKIEFLFSAGMYQQQMPLQATTVNTMLEEGTSTLSASQIADKVDYYGAYLETGVSQDSASVVLYTLNKHLQSTLPVVEQVIKDSVFPQNELETHIRNKKQKFHVNNQKVAILARKRFTELLFGAKHPYGINVQEADFEVINREHLLSFYSTHYRSNNCKIIVSGKVDENVVKLLDTYFGGSDWDGTAIVNTTETPISTFTQPQELLFKEDALQSAIRVGKLLFNKKHADYQSFLVLNTILGGYFGSRLMSNIREDKGYTYGIGSGLASLQNSGYFFISTEVGVDVCQSALNEIYSEVKRLREEPIPAEELQLVKNYMLGTFLRSVDGPFALAERFKGIMEYNLDYDYFDNYVATIKNISASQLRDLANKYLTQESMVELVVGKK